MRLAQPCRQQPALAGAQFLRRRTQQGIAVEAAVPAQRYQSGHLHRLADQQRLFDAEDEARALRPGLRGKSLPV